MDIKLPGSVALIIRELEKHGHEAYAVGGCVRDAVMGRIPHDWDITTSAKPEEVKAIFNKTIDTGIKHGTVTVMISRVGYEVTTFRVDGRYEDGRHPAQVEFTANLEKDLERRDFTINAMAYNQTVGIVDKFNGVKDLENKVIRCVGNPMERFSEDALRILRAVRFAAQLDFEIEQGTYGAIKALKDSLDKISRERIQAELEKLLMSENPEKLILLYESGTDKVIFDERLIPECNSEDDCEKEWQQLCESVKAVRADHYLRWAAFLSKAGSNSGKTLKSLKFDNKTVDIVSKLTENGDTLPCASPEAVRRHICKVGRDIYGLYLEYVKNVLKRDTSDLENIFNEIMANNDCLSIRELAVKGQDLKEAGIEPGKEMGYALERLFDMVLKEPDLNRKEKLLEIVSGLKNNV